VLFLYPEQGALAVLQLLQLGYAPEKIALPLFQVGYPDYTRLIPDLAKIERSVTAAFKDPNPIFVEKFKKRFGYAPSSWAGFGYDGLILLAKSYATDTTTWNNNITEANIDGVSGKVEFDDVGVRTWVGDVLTVGDYIKKLKT
jgi:ABC-type branched-subunit amino acid transport system substrate-binding protein